MEKVTVMFPFVWQMLILIIGDLQLESYYYHFCSFYLSINKKHILHIFDIC